MHWGALIHRVCRAVGRVRISSQISHNNPLLPRPIDCRSVRLGPQACKRRPRDHKLSNGWALTLRYDAKAIGLYCPELRIVGSVVSCAEHQALSPVVASLGLLCTDMRGLQDLRNGGIAHRAFIPVSRG